MVSVEELKERFEYRKGKLFYKKTVGARKKGLEAGYEHHSGYRQIIVNGICYRLHRLIWFYHYEVWPKDQLDHIDGDNTNNRIENLREATRSQNNWNTKSRSGSSSRFKGVHRFRNRWRARCCINGKYTSLGCFETEEEAAKAYASFVKPLHGEFYRDT